MEHDGEVSDRIEQAGLELEVVADKRVNYALQQNAVPLIKVLRVHNRSDRAYQQASVTLSLEPDLAEPRVFRLDTLAAQSSYSLKPENWGPSAGKLRQQTEMERASILVDLTVGQQRVARQRSDVQVLAHNEWSGDGSLPEILAAFITPNSPGVTQVLRLAREVLQRDSGDPSFSGYQTRDRQRVRMTAEAVYRAIQNLGITYVEPPASFEKSGQKVRTPEQILDAKMGTCLDLALLLASCLEQVGLNTMLLLFEGHALPAVWLENDSLPVPCTDDLVRIRKNADLGVLLPFDSSSVAALPRMEFGEAVRVAERFVKGAKPFAYAVDVKAARDIRILPLPGPGVATAEQPAEEVPAASGPRAYPVRSEAGEWGSRRTALSAAEALGTGASDSGSQAPLAGQDERSARLERWKRRLLDMSLRNRLLNFKEGKRTVRLLHPSIADLEDLIAAGESFSIAACPDRFGDDDPRDSSLLGQKTGADPLEEYLRREADKRRLHANLPDAELQGNLLGIYREARLASEESGTNLLYLALGFVAWSEGVGSPARHLAPILLLPVELTRGAISEGFRLRAKEEEPRINVTFLEKMRSEFGVSVEGLDELPEDSSGRDIPLIMQRFRKAIHGMANWEVVEEAHLGLFSFAKYLMWLDLHQQTEQLLNNGMIRRLLGDGTCPGDPSVGAGRQASTDDEMDPADTYTVLDADSSQLQALLAARKGQDFVLEGPPGTGKSQTITNLIVDSMAHGKSVLFVSEKMAALNVVHERLKRTGMEPFCLELHSNKTNKSQVLKHTAARLNMMPPAGDATWKERAASLRGLRDRLNKYATELHKPYPCGLSAFFARSTLIGSKVVPEIRKEYGDVREVTKQELDGLRSHAVNLARVSSELGTPNTHLWSAVRLTECGPQVERQLPVALEAVRAKSEALLAAGAALGGKAQVPLADSSWTQLGALRGILNPLLAQPPLARKLWRKGSWETHSTLVYDVCRRGMRRQETRARLGQKYLPYLYSMDLQSTRAKLEKWSHPGIWVVWIAWLVLLGLRWNLKRYALRKDGAAASLGPTEQVMKDLLDALEVQSQERVLEERQDWGADLLGAGWQGVDTDWGQLESAAQWLDDFELRLSAVRSCWPSEVRLDEWFASLCGLPAPEWDSAQGAIQRFVQAYDELAQAKENLNGLLQLEPSLAWGADDKLGALQVVTERGATWQRESSSLASWCAYQGVASEARTAGLGALVEAHWAGTVSALQVVPAFEKSVAAWFHEAVVSGTPALNQFVSSLHNGMISDFKKQDVELFRTSGKLVEAMLCARANFGEVRSDQEGIGLVRRETMKQKRHMPIRRLVEKAGPDLMKLHPCWLMSPLSVAQYLPASCVLFDLVVFDEASQIPPWDAVGAIGRGKQVVVVGDSRQLPPTAFFQKEDSDASSADDDEGEELESILHECNAVAGNRLWLAWHYRSRHENLIAFSNSHYYENRLLTFPNATPETDSLGVKLRYLPKAVYDKAKSRTNRMEAEAVVAEVVRRLTSTGGERGCSLGVVTFSSPQQLLIENLMDEARREHPEIDPYFTDQVNEPVFVKNLENVQGDERDVMIFSICYGPDAQGRVSMNFGPLNKQGGERRLNVAVTRARQLLLVFASLRSDQIDLSRTQASGVAQLRTFLDYAARGPRAISESITGVAQGESESPFEEDVFRALTAKGWNVHKQVGCSGYRIDMAVVDPACPGRYLVGIECDGATYHSARSARDRDRLRQSVLEGLGWTILRIWSTDWLRDPERQLQSLHQHLQTMLQRQGVSGQSHPQVQPANRLVVADSQPPQTARIASSPTSSATIAATAIRLSGAETYRRAGPFSAGPGSEPLDLDDPRFPHVARQAIQHVLDAEAPVHRDQLLQRLRVLLGFTRLGSRIAQALSREVEYLEGANELQVVDEYVWKCGQHPASWSLVRQPDREDTTVRQVEHICNQELANAAIAVLEQVGPMPQDRLVRAMGGVFQLPAMTIGATARLSAVVNAELASGRIRSQGDLLSLR